MIFYRNTRLNFFKLLFRVDGSVFPHAFGIAFPAAIACGLLKWLFDGQHVQPHTDTATAVLMNESAVWGGFTFLVGFLMTFRTSISYGRFWDGMTSSHRMRAEWFDACASLCAFCKFSDQSPKKILEFQHTLIRLVSLLHAVALAQLEDSNTDNPLSVEAFSLGLLDDVFIDDTSLLAVRESFAKPELAFQWIQQLIVENIKTGVLSVPPPILSRAFQELATGMVEFHEALKVSSVPFPFPYAQVCDFLLFAHAIMTPIILTQWVNDRWWAMAFCFLQLFVMWSLRFIAVELENPFGSDANDLDQHLMQEEMNHHLWLLVTPCCQRTPKLTSVAAAMDSSPSQVPDGDRSLNFAWYQAACRMADACDQTPDGQRRAASLLSDGPARSTRKSITARHSSRSVHKSIFSRVGSGSRRTSGEHDALRYSPHCEARHSFVSNSSSEDHSITQAHSLSTAETLRDICTGKHRGTGYFPQNRLDRGEAIGNHHTTILGATAGDVTSLDPIFLDFTPSAFEERLNLECPNREPGKPWLDSNILHSPDRRA